MNPGDATPATAETSSRSLGQSLVLWALIFGLSYTQAPLYYSNQNQYFLHGLAHAGHGRLHDDWLAQLRDPTPVFTAFVSAVARFLHEYFFYLVYLVLLGAYFHSLLGVAGRLHEASWTARTRLLLATLLVLIHAALLRLASAHWLGVDFPWYLQAGVAGQYVLGFGLQPSVFGVLLLASILTFLHDRHWLAIALACLAAILHATYLLVAAFVVIAYLVVLMRDGRPQHALLLGAGALLFVAPSVVYNLAMFAPSSSEAFAEAQRILAHIRIPHHAEPSRWFDAVALGQVVWILAATLLTWRSRLFTIMSIVFAFALFLTLVQVMTGSDTLALLFPWRASALLMPLATMIILSHLVMLAVRCLGWLSEQDLGVVCGMILGVCITGGIVIMALGLGFRTDPAELPLLDYVKAHNAPGDVYLVPVEIPKIGGGAASTNFTPAPRRGKNGHLIAIDLQRFRIHTGAAIYVDFKSIPYRDVEVLEWHRRLLLAQRLYATTEWDAPALLDELTRERITHVIVPADRPLRSPVLVEAYRDDAYVLYRLPSR